ncbi:MAG: NAD-dependent epimerase/dehydratase family protein [Patescibacteria group bacterium]
MHIVITGIAGAIGSHVAERLLLDGHTVVGIDCVTSYYSKKTKMATLSEIKKAGAHIYLLDLTKDDLAKVIAPADVIFHFAAQPGISATTPFDDYVRNNIVATQRLLEAMVTHAPKAHLIFASTSSVYGVQATGNENAVPRPTSAYGATKLAAEQLALGYQRTGKLSVTVLRLFSVYGPRERPEKLFHRLIKHIHDGSPFPLHKGSEKHVRSFSFIGDVVDGCVAALVHRKKISGEIINLGTDKTHTTGEGIKLVEKIMKKKALVMHKPPRPGDQSETRAHIRKAKKLLDYRPKTTLEEGLKKEVAWFLHNRS